MKKELIKIGIIFFVVVGLVLFGLNYVFFNQNAPKSKAAGETMNISFFPSTQTAAVNQDFTVSVLVKPSINTILRGYKTKVNFDKTKLSFKSIQYKLGVVSAGLGNTTADVAAINSSGFINIIGEDTTAIGYTLPAANGAELVSLTFTALSTSGVTVTMTDSAFYSINADMSLFGDWIVTAQNLDVNGGSSGGGGPTLTPTPTGGGVTGNNILNLKLKFQGITSKPADGQDSMTVKVGVGGCGATTPTYTTGTFTADDSGIWSGAVGFNLDTCATDNYIIYIKGPSHIQRKICDAVPTESSPGTYSCSAGKISISAGQNNFDFSGILLLSGDLDQNGIVDSVDIAIVKNNLGKTDAATLAQADINRDGVVDTQDFSLILAALAMKTDEQ